jgi:hypothetical protein
MDNPPDISEIASKLDNLAAIIENGFKTKQEVEAQIDERLNLWHQTINTKASKVISDYMEADPKPNPLDMLQAIARAFQETEP